MNRSPSSPTTIRFPSRRTPVTRKPSISPGAGLTDRSTNGFRTSTRSSTPPTTLSARHST
jgi:hypothetical protein